MAKIVLRNGTNGARTKIIDRFKLELTHVFYAKAFGTINLDETLNATSRQNLSSDGTSKLVELVFASGFNDYRTNSSINNMDDRKITNFYMIGGAYTYARFIFGSYNAGLLTVKGIITGSASSPSVNTAFFVNQFRIQVLDQT